MALVTRDRQILRILLLIMPFALKEIDMVTALLQCVGMWLVISIPSALFVGLMMGRMNREPEPLRLSNREAADTLGVHGREPISSYEAIP